MALRDDLLRPISEESPAGVDLSYDKLFDQIKEARTEDDESLPTGTWSRAAKRADRSLVIKLAGDGLATKSKDLRLAGWYAESLLRREGFAQLQPLFGLLQALQEQFWATLFPLQDEDGDLGRRAGALEGAAGQLAAQLRLLPVTQSGVSGIQAQDARALPYEKDATTQEKKDARDEAVQRGRILPEELDKAIADTPKAFYAEGATSLQGAVAALEVLDAFHDERYGGDAPSLARLKNAISGVDQFITGVLAEKRKVEPDPEIVVVEAVPDTPQAQEGLAPEAEGLNQGETLAEMPEQKPALASEPASAGRVTTTVSASRADALTQMAGAVLFLSGKGSAPELAYMLASAPGLALLFTAGPDTAWPAPLPGVRQRLRQMAREKQWAALERAALEAMAAQPETIWLDLQRYVWEAAEELGHQGLSAAVVMVVQQYVQQLPDLDRAMLDDDTPTASMETQRWLRALKTDRPSEEESLKGGLTAREQSARLAEALDRGPDRAKGSTESSLEEAKELLKKGQAAAALGLLAREADAQPSGRLRFEKRLAMGELCLEAGHAAVAQPLLADLAAELERRTLEGWESPTLLGKPLALTIRCLDEGASASDSRETLFSRLCRLDPAAAATLDRTSKDKVR